MLIYANEDKLGAAELVGSGSTYIFTSVQWRHTPQSSTYVSLTSDSPGFVSTLYAIKIHLLTYCATLKK